MSSLSLRRVHQSVRNGCQYRGFATSTPKSMKSAYENSADVSGKTGSTATTIPKSACLADTVLPGLSYLKGQEPVLAKPDEWYPEWLWTLLETKKVESDGTGGKQGKTQRKENKQRIKQRTKERNFMSTQ